MPYIKRETREFLDPIILHSGNLSPGELNYVITRLMQEWVRREPGYVRYNAAIGVLECAKLELYRRLVAPYEDGKKQENGDVY